MVGSSGYFYDGVQCWRLYCRLAPSTGPAAHRGCLFWEETELGQTRLNWRTLFRRPMLSAPASPNSSLRSFRYRPEPDELPFEFG